MRVGLVSAAVALVLAGTSAAAWPIQAAGGGSARAGSLVGSQPTATKTNALTITLSWTATPGATGYSIKRTGGVGQIGGTCSGTVAATTCADTPVVALTTYTYTVTPLAGNWVGTVGPGRSITA
jgi:hypothetical protein